MAWIKFHEELTRGAKRGIPRALRFVLMELSILARPLRGRLELPAGMSDKDAVCDLLGGNRKEVLSALTVFTSPPDPSIFFENDGGRRYLSIPSWERWNAGAVEAPGASTERSRRFREAQRDATAVARPTQQSATPPRSEEIRSEEKRDQIPPVSADQGSVTTRARPEPPSAHTPARATAVEPIPSALPAIASPDDIAAMLAAEPALCALAAEPRYADRIAGQLLASGITRDLAQRTIRDFALKRAHDGPDTRPEILAQALGGFFARARREGSAARESEPMAPEVRETLAAFDAAWSKAHGGQVRAHDARDPEHAAKLVELARDVAQRSKGVDYREILAHKTRGYLADREKLVMDSDHPLRLFASRFSAYGMPTGPTRPSGPKPDETQRRALTADEMAKVRAETPGMDRFLKPIARAS